MNLVNPLSMTGESCENRKHVEESCNRMASLERSTEANWCYLPTGGLWSWISVLFVDRTPGTIGIRTGILKPITKRRVSARIGERQENIIICIVTLPGVTGSRFRCTAWLYLTLCEVMSSYSLCIPATERTIKRFGRQGADSPAAENRRSCVSLNRAPYRGTCERKLRV